jgi:Rieske Fe-S protein
MTNKPAVPGAYKPSKKRSEKLPTHCQHNGCKIKLSMYNLTNFCSLHESQNSILKDSI